MIIIKNKAQTYKELQKAINGGKLIQLSTINSKGIAVDWHTVNRVNKNFDPNRYRIVIDEDAEFEKKIEDGFYYNDKEDKWYKAT